MIRPAAMALVWRWGEPALAAGFALIGMWLATRGGWVLIPIGLALTAMALAWGWNSYGRVRFVQSAGAPGLVELDEAELTYFSPGNGAGLGGGMGLGDVQEIRLVTIRGRRLWWLRGDQTRPLLIPVDASGNAALFDAFSSLPGLTPAMLLAALDRTVAQGPGLIPVTPAFHPVWRRSGSGLVRQ
jgi:hypothetical protein